MIQSSNETFDYVVVGGGLAGCVVAARLSEDPQVRVILLEAGRENDYEPSYFATGVHSLWTTEANWGFESVPQTGLQGHRISHPRGRLIGGSAAINVGSWSRGIAADYDRWAAGGAAGWDWATARAAYLAIETSRRPEAGGRGKHGPMILEDTPVVSEMTEAFRQACLEIGIGETVDHNGERFEGFDRWETIFPRGRRRNSAEAYLAPARIRSNLQVLTSVRVLKVKFEGKRATGVVVGRDGRMEVIEARAEVVLCAGAFQSPQILMTSGIGPADHLRAIGIEPLVDSAGVGENLIDHLGTRMGWAAAGLGGVLPVYPDINDTQQLEDWRHSGNGPLAANDNPCIAFTRSSDKLEHADIELLFHVNPPENMRVDNKIGGFVFVVANVDPASRGNIRLATSDPHDLPLVDPRYLSDPADLPALVGGVRRALALAKTRALAPYSSRYELSVDAPDNEIEGWIRSRPVSMYHPVGTAKMGAADDPSAVLDPELRVKGVDGLRVVDASAMPSTIRGHTMAPVVFIAERGCKLIHNSRKRPT